MSEELKPCPFCQGEASRQDLTDADNAGGSCIVCDRCGASSPVHFDRKENLYDSWNRRASPTPPTTEGWEAIRREALEEAAKVAERGCLTHPDGGSPTEPERELCEAIARDIRALTAKETEG